MIFQLSYKNVCAWLDDATRCSLAPFWRPKHSQQGRATAVSCCIVLQDQCCSCDTPSFGCRSLARSARPCGYIVENGEQELNDHGASIIVIQFSEMSNSVSWCIRIERSIYIPVGTFGPLLESDFCQSGAISLVLSQIVKCNKM